MVSRYKDVPVDTRAYRRVMNLVGKCIASGGEVTLTHRTKELMALQSFNLKGHYKDTRVDVIDVVLTWNVNT